MRFASVEFKIVQDIHFGMQISARLNNLLNVMNLKLCIFSYSFDLMPVFKLTKTV